MLSINKLGLWDEKENIIYYHYREALLKHPLIEIPSSSETRAIQTKICKEINEEPDNHTVVIIGDIAIAFDDDMKIGQAKNVIVEKY